MRKLYLPLVMGMLCTQTAFAEIKKDCPAPTKTKVTVDKNLRKSAQRGLDYLVTASEAWTKQHKCYGCHVQAVTLEGLTVGRHNQYKVSTKNIESMVAALKLGVTAGGRKTGAAFQGAAWARYDRWVDNEQTDELLKYARELLQYQTEAGAVEDDDRRPPIVAGTMQTTFQAMQTWRQAFARTADEMWLGPMRKAEQYLANSSGAWKPQQSISILDLNYALMGLTEAGAKPSEGPSMKLQRMLVARQRKDGGFGLQAEHSDALATGQTLYALKLAGYNDRDPVIAKGMRWLLSHQAKDGAWHTVKSGQRGADIGEAMWAVLGMVSMDVMSLSIAGVQDGQRVDRTIGVSATAVDNQGTGIARIEMLVDDVSVATACGPKLTHKLDASTLAEGKHLLDFVASNAEGKISRRRIEFYTGDTYMTHLGTRFDEARQTTEISLRNIGAPGPSAGTIRLEVLTTDSKPKTVYDTSTGSHPGPMTLRWNGKSSKNKALPSGRYVALVSFVSAQGRMLQQEELMFFHDTAKKQREQYGEVQGRIQHSKDSSSSANTVVELVDKEGRVMQSTRSTAQGNYRFKNIDKGKYRVRVKKKGFKDWEGEVEAAPKSAPATADIALD